MRALFSSGGLGHLAHVRGPNVESGEVPFPVMGWVRYGGSRPLPLPQRPLEPKGLPSGGN